MAKPPYFPFYVKDFAADSVVESMSTLEVGTYILLLCKAWHEDPPGSIPNDDTVLARWARLDATIWQDCKPRVLAAFMLGTDNRYHQKRMRSEYSKLATLTTARREAGKKGALVKHGKASGYVTGKASGKASGKTMADGSGSNSGFDSSDGERGVGKGARKRRKKTIFPPVPDLLANVPEFVKAWDCWLAHRSEKNATLTPTAAEQQLKKLAELGPERAIAALAHSTANGYTGVYEDRNGQVAKPGLYDGLASFAAREEAS